MTLNKDVGWLRRYLVLLDDRMAGHEDEESPEALDLSKEGV
jgi:hypothetical protein